MDVKSYARGERFEQLSYAKNPIDLLEEERRLQCTLCDVLETIADGLPDDVNPELVSSAVKALQLDLPLHYRDDDEALFPLLRQRSANGDTVREMLDCLSAEHAVDSGFADEIMESIQPMEMGSRPGNPNMVGYMLRGFFTCYRRHLLWEMTVVLPMARRMLTEEDLDQLLQRFDAHREAAKSGAAQAGNAANVHEINPQ